MNRKIAIFLLIIGILLIILSNQNELFGNYKTTCNDNWLPGLLNQALKEREIVVNKDNWVY